MRLWLLLAKVPRRVNAPAIMFRPPILAALLLASCSPPAAAPLAAPPLVTVAKPTKQIITEWDEYSGRLEAKEMVDIRARVAGYLEGIHFEEGRDVQEGALLFTIDKRPYQAEFEHAQADCERLQSRAKLAASEFERARDLLASRAVSQQDFDTKVQAQAEAQAAIRAAQAALDTARLNLDFTEIHAPISGRIGNTMVTKGNLVVGGLTATSATLLANIVSVDPIYCYLEVDEQAALRYRHQRQEGTRTSALDVRIPCEMALSDEEGFPRKGEIDFVDNKLDPGTGTIRARGVFKNDGRLLSPGFFARVRIPGNAPYEALLVPESAIGTDLAQKYVFVAKADGTAEVRPVVPGVLQDGLRVIRAGLQPEDQVIVNGQARVRDKMKITLQ